MPYLLDANVFMSASRLHYGFDFCPAFWDWLIEANRARRVFSIDKVEGEIRAGSDELVDWASKVGEDFFLRPDQESLDALAAISDWCSRQRYGIAALNTFLGGADSFLVAHALAHQHILITHEKPSNSRSKIKIPTVCFGIGVTPMNPFEMLRRERARFVLGGSMHKAAGVATENILI